MNLRTEHFDNGDVIYLALNPDGVWAHSEFPADNVTVDFDAEDRIIGVEVVGATNPTLLPDLVKVLVPDHSQGVVMGVLEAEHA
jgi:uncharacterized protein YuzE